MHIGESGLNSALLGFNRVHVAKALPDISKPMLHVNAMAFPMELPLPVIIPLLGVVGVGHKAEKKQKIYIIKTLSIIFPLEVVIVKLTTTSWCLWYIHGTVSIFCFYAVSHVLSYQLKASVASVHCHVSDRGSRSRGGHCTIVWGSRTSTQSWGGQEVL